ncbi:hypothetical protein BD414DRAFT_533239 [Trametes punicea]|nr:hypothetical protein BD414DRAFT_533239 [Trametes punicea]
MAGVTADDQALTYLVPEGKDSEHSTVVMHFVGRKDQVVTVEVPARYFLYTDNPMTGKREGLIFALTEFEKKGFLGVNFFHSAWVALYKPNADVPYVRIAAQDHSTAGVERFQLPPMSPAP